MRATQEEKTDKAEEQEETSKPQEKQSESLKEPKNDEKEDKGNVGKQKDEDKITEQNMEGVDKANSRDEKTENVQTAVQQEGREQNDSQLTEKRSDCQKTPIIPGDGTSVEGTAGTSKRKVSECSRFLSRNFSVLPRQRESREFESPSFFCRQGKHREFVKKYLKYFFYLGNLPPTEGKF